MRAPVGGLATVRAVRTRIWLVCALTAVLAVGCSADAPEPEIGGPAGEDPGTPSGPSGVVGTVAERTVTDLSNAGSGLHPDGSPADDATPIDQGAVDAAAEAATRWLDAHLTDLQAGGTGHVAGAGLEGDTAAAADLANPDHPVTSASYVVTVGARGGPEWLRVGAVVGREDGERTATFVFVPAGDEVTLLAVELGDGTPAPAAEATEETS
jgi:hypothetical protein